MSTNEPFSIGRWLADPPVSSLGWLLLVSGLLFFAGGAYYTVTGLAHDRSLEQHGRSVDGNVLGKSVYISGRRSKTYHYTVTFNFVPSRGENISDTVEVDRNVWGRFREQGTIRVTYLPDKPAIRRVEGQDARFSVWTLLMYVYAGGLMLFIGKCMLNTEQTDCAHQKSIF